MTNHDCGCDAARAQLVDFLRRELCADDSEQVTTHIECCEDCADEAKVELVISETVKRCCSNDTAPDNLRMRVVALLSEHCGGKLPTGD